MLINKRFCAIELNHEGLILVPFREGDAFLSKELVSVHDMLELVLAHHECIRPELNQE